MASTQGASISNLWWEIHGRKKHILEVSLFNCKCHSFFYILCALLNQLQSCDILYTKQYVPIKLCKTSGSIHLFKLMGSINRENVTLHRNTIWDIMEIDW